MCIKKSLTLFRVAFNVKSNKSVTCFMIYLSAVIYKSLKLIFQNDQHSVAFYIMLSRCVSLV